MKHSKIKYLISLIALTFVLSQVLTYPTVLAAGDAYFSLSSSSNSYVVGNSFTLNVTETSSSTDNVQGVQADLSYNTTYLRFNSLTTTGSPFNLCAQQTGGNGSVEVSCASSPNPVGGGTYPVAQISFTALTAGSTSVGITSSSDIQNNNESSVWNGQLTTTNFSFSNPLPAPTPTPTPTNTTKSTAPKQTNTNPIVTSTTKTTTPTTTPVVVTSPNSSTIAESPPLGTLSIVITSSSGKPIYNAKVIIDHSQTRYTNKNGLVVFKDIHTGKNTLAITATGNKSSTYSIVVTAGNNKPLTFRLTKSFSPLPIIVLAAIVVVLLLIAIIYWRIRIRHQQNVIPLTQPSSNSTIPVFNNLSNNLGTIIKPTLATQNSTSDNSTSPMPNQSFATPQPQTTQPMPINNTINNTETLIKPTLATQNSTSDNSTSPMPNQSFATPQPQTTQPMPAPTTTVLPTELNNQIIHPIN